MRSIDCFCYCASKKRTNCSVYRRYRSYIILAIDKAKNAGPGLCTFHYSLLVLLSAGSLTALYY